MPLYRAYLMENGHVWIDLTCVNDDDAKRQALGMVVTSNFGRATAKLRF
jgi:hypothetical protein